MSVQMIAETLSIPKTTVHDIVTNNFHMREVCQVGPQIVDWRPQEQPSDNCGRKFDFLDNVITGDRTWAFEYDPETRCQSSEWHTSESPSPKKARMSKSKVKTMLTVFFDDTGVVHKEFVPQGCMLPTTWKCSTD
jgi:hypothetical protein